MKNSFTRFGFSKKNGTLLLLMIMILWSSENPAYAQLTINIQTLADLEFSIAGKNSHYYYNEIDRDHTDPRISMAQLNLISQIKLNKHWSINARVLLERDKGKKFNNLSTPLLHIQYLSANRKWGLSLGNFINPFGSFNKKQLSTDRNFIGLPLAYSYYHNISDKIGYMAGMGDIIQFPIDNEVQWGSTNIYYGGYATGLLFSWTIKPAKLSWKTALVTGASNLQKRITDPVHFGLISRLKYQPVYFWEQGISVSHGSFIQASPFSNQLDHLYNFTQTVIGTDYKLGFGFFEISGELMASFYKVPQFISEDALFETGNQNLSNVAAYLDVKYEPSILQGSYVAYRIDHLRFIDAGNNSIENWDNDVLRHSLAIGYHIHKHILARAAVSTQHVATKKWDKTQRTLRVVLTVHY